MDYPVTVAPLSEEDGGGYIAFYPDLVGCASDGETAVEALENARDAFEGWMEIARQREGFVIPLPGDKAKREAESRRLLADTLRKYEDALQQLDGVLTNELQELRTRIECLEEAIEEQDAWQRFQSITGSNKQMALPTL